MNSDVVKYLSYRKYESSLEIIFWFTLSQGENKLLNSLLDFKPSTVRAHNASACFVTGHLVRLKVQTHYRIYFRRNLFDLQKQRLRLKRTVPEMTLCV